METGLIENTMSFEESLKQISPSDKNAKPIKVSLLKQLRKRYYWRLENQYRDWETEQRVYNESKHF